MRIGIIAAMPGELKPLVKSWDKVPVARGSGVAMWQRSTDGDDVVAVCAGMGAAAARRAFAAAEHAGSLDMVLSVGWAGGLTDRELVSPVMSEVIDAQTGERFLLTDGKRRLRLVTSARVADAVEKRRLAETYGAVAVDMEAAHVARLAQMRGVPMGVFKAISDGFELDLPDINPFIDANGKLRISGLLGYVVARPRYWGPLLQMGKNSARAAALLAETLEKFLKSKDLERVNRTGGVE